MEYNKGFTLIELLAVIVILSVIALISFPIILGIVEKIQVASYKESLRGVFGATDLYIATSEFGDIPTDGINVTDENIRLKNKAFTSGKIIKNSNGQLELEKVSNGHYCGSGTLDNIVIIEGSCDALDTTPPTITIGLSTVMSNSITIVANGTDLESGISGYQFSKDDGITWTSKQISNVYTFSGLKSNTNYTFKVKLYNNNLLSTESNSLEVTTNNISLPTYIINTISWTQSAVVTINYPERQLGYIYEYSLNEGVTWEEVASPAITKDVTFTSNGSVIARISDGTNIVSGVTYEVTNIDATSPLITVNPEVVTIENGSVYNDTGVTAIDAEEGDITGNIVTTGNVDTTIAGTYTLIYNVSDAAGNIAESKTRTVIVEDSLIGTESNPGQSCKDILDQGSSVGNGIYWIGNPAFEVYCDMTSSGGGWTLVMNNVGNKNDLDLTSSTINSITDISQHGNINFIDWLDGTKEIRWTAGNSFTNNNLLLHVQENGTIFSKRPFPVAATTTCPISSGNKYQWIKIYSDAGWSNQHYSANYGSCSGWTDYGTNIYNYYSHGDCASCYSPVNAFFGNGYSGYYSWGNIYDTDGLGWDGRGFFNDIAPSFWSAALAHQLWIK